jgi:hypothetical protein
MYDTKNTVSVDRDGISNNTNDLFRTSPVGSISSAISDSFYGINHRQTPGMVPPNKDYYGYTFFTRPLMNLTSENIRGHRELSHLLTKNEKSIPRVIRCLLDPRLALNYKGNPIISTPLVDNQNPFIPLLTNNLISMNGYPDIVAPIFESQQGMYKEVFGFVDGIININQSFDITANFRNLSGDPITFMFHVWLQYMQNVFEGIMVPHMDNLIQRRIDYNTRIYRLVMDPSKRFIKKIAATNASIPISTPLGQAFNFDSQQPIDATNAQIGITFRSFGARYNDPILIKEFNETSKMFNKSMVDTAKEIETAISDIKAANLKDPGKELHKASRKNGWVRLADNEVGIMNNRGYPYINPDTYELVWYLDEVTYNSILAGF